jgi:glycerol kinase
MASSPLFLQVQKSPSRLYELSTMMPAAGYAGPKLGYLQATYREPQHGIGTLDGFLVARLFNRDAFSIEESMAHRSLLYSWRARSFDSELCDNFDIQMSRLPTIQPSLLLRGMWQSWPLTAVLGDQQAALLFLQQSVQACPILMNLGTIASILCVAAEEQRAPEGYLRSILTSAPCADSHSYRYVIEATSNCCGTTLEKVLGLVPELVENQNALSALTLSEDILAFCPFGELTTPDWRVSIDNVCTEGFIRANDDIRARVLLENLGNFLLEDLQNLQQAGCLEQNQLPIPVSGGGSQSNYLLQYLADCSGYSFARVTLADFTACGAAVAAALQTGVSIHPNIECEQIFHPADEQRKRYRFEPWRRMKKQILQGNFSGTVSYPVHGS